MKMRNFIVILGFSVLGFSILAFGGKPQSHYVFGTDGAPLDTASVSNDTLDARTVKFISPAVMDGSVYVVGSATKLSGSDATIDVDFRVLGQIYENEYGPWTSLGTIAAGETTYYLSFNNVSTFKYGHGVDLRYRTSGNYRIRGEVVAR